MITQRNQPGGKSLQKISTKKTNMNKQSHRQLQSNTRDEKRKKAGEADSPVKRLLQKHEDLSWKTPHLWKCWGELHVSATPALVGRQEDPEDYCSASVVV